MPQLKRRYINKGLCCPHTLMLLISSFISGQKGDFDHHEPDYRQAKSLKEGKWACCWYDLYHSNATLMVQSVL